jgi:HSP20 family protein
MEDYKMTIMRMHRDPFLRFWMNNGWNENEGSYMPSTNIVENQDAYRLDIAAPGFRKEDFRIDIEKNILTVKTETENQASDEEKYNVREFVNKDFSRSFSLPETIDQENIKAEYINGVLSVTLPRKEEVKMKKEIQVA